MRFVAAVALRRSGYHVVEASTAAEALHLWEERRAAITLLLTDLVMPGGISGEKLADELCDRQPALRVIYTSGYNGAFADRQRFKPGTNFLPKPYLVEDLLAIVRRRLDER